MVGSQKFASTDATTIRQHCQVYASSQNDGALEIICVCVCVRVNGMLNGKITVPSKLP